MILLALSFAFFSCKQAQKENTNVQTDSIQANADSGTETLQALIESEIQFYEKDFGPIIELQGTTHPVEPFFKVSECEMIALDTVLIVKNRSNSDLFMAFSLPSFKFIKSFGKLGRGPNEFQFPSLVPDESGAYGCCIYEMKDNKLFGLHKNLDMEEIPIQFEAGEKNFNDKQLYAINSTELLYVESIKMGKALFKIDASTDSTTTTLLKKLAFSDKYKNWAAYIGNFGANGDKKRAVFAYKYFKRLVFYDLENHTSKVVNFDTSAETESGDPVSMMDPSNVTHYWGMSSNRKYVYVLYSGRSPIDVTDELKNSSGYIYVEQYDWNGNPIRKFKLDHWGYFCVNEKEDTIFLVSTTDEHPFITYQLPNNEQ